MPKWPALYGGEIGAGHSVTVIYDVVFKSTQGSPLTVRVRHKPPVGPETATESAVRMEPASIAASFDAAPADVRFASAVAGFAEILRQSPHAKDWTLASVEQIARSAAGGGADQQELVELVGRAKRLSGPAAAVAR